MVIEDFFIQLVLILLSARFLGELASKFSIPPVIGELIAGVILGPSLLDWVEPTDTIKLLAEIGIILLLFEVGLETNIARLAQTGYKPFIVASVGVIAPFILGFIISYYSFGLDLLISLFIASTLTATSIGITIRVLTDLKRQDGHETQIVLGAAVIDDIIGIVLLSILYEFSTGGGIQLWNAAKVLLFIGIFLFLAPLVAKLISGILKRYAEMSSIPGLLPTTIVSLLLLFAWLAHQLGAPELLGGFAAGLALSRRFFLPLGAFLHTSPDFAHKIEDQMRPIVHLFTPIFFVTVGLSLNLKEVDWSSSFIWALSGSLLIAAILGKLCSGFSLWKENFNTQCAVGIAMIPRGEVGLIFAEVGRTYNIFDNDIYATLILVIAFTTLFTPFVMRIFYNYFPIPTEEDSVYPTEIPSP